MDIDDLYPFRKIQKLSDPLQEFKQTLRSIEDPLGELKRQLESSLYSNSGIVRQLESPLYSNGGIVRQLENPLYSNGGIVRQLGDRLRSNHIEQMQLNNFHLLSMRTLDAYKSISSALANQNIVEHKLALQRQALSRANQFRIPSITDVSYLYRNVDGGVIQPKTWARDVLRKGLWTIDDESVIEYLANNLHTRTNPEEYICYYYSNNRWAKLAAIVEGWAKCEAIHNRYEILKEIFDNLIFTQGANFNSKRIAMQALIIQIEGIRRDIADIILPDTRHDLKVNDDFITHEYGIETNLRDQKICSFISKHISHDYAITFHDVICHGVFLKTDKFEELMKKRNIPIKFNRHIMVHGYTGYSNYGTTENVIRAFLYLDFMIKIIAKLNDRTYH